MLMSFVSRPNSKLEAAARERNGKEERERIDCGAASPLEAELVRLCKQLLSRRLSLLLLFILESRLLAGSFGVAK